MNHSQITRLLKDVLGNYRLPLSGCHGVAHWARVLENGILLSKQTGANLNVVWLFAILHDSRRQNESHDPDHGPRAADYARLVRGDLIDLDDHEFKLLCRACEGHTRERTHPNITIQTCWDSDRLDLGRVGIIPEPERLCTGFARRSDVIFWADRRASENFIPEFVGSEWGIEL